jgi:hypothetical protein
MPIAMRKLAMLEKAMIAIEEKERINGYSTCSIDKDLRRRIKDLVDRARVI